MPRYEKSRACQDWRTGPSCRDEDDEVSLCDAIARLDPKRGSLRVRGETTWALCAHSVSRLYHAHRASPASPVPTRLRHCPMRPQLTLFHWK
eukprot:9300672-Alexandrium_andersonii.AAC.1